MVDLRETLRRDTRTLHDQVEASYPFNQLVCPDITSSDYVEALFRLYRLHTHLLRSISQLTNPRHSLVTIFQPDIRAACEKLECDLEAHSVIATQKFLDEIMPVEEFSSDAECVGGGYVLFGSSLGAKVVYPALKKNLPDTFEHHYYSHLVAGRHWSEFLQRLKTQQFSQDEIAEAVAGAKKSFMLLSGVGKPGK